MQNKLNEKLKEVISKRLEIQRLKRALAETRSTLEREEQRLLELEATMKQEEEDVKRLEGLSLGTVFHTILGDKDVRLDKEKREFLRAKMRYDEVRYAVDSLNSELRELKNACRYEAEIEQEYQELLQQKEQYLLSSTNGESRLLAINEQLAQAQAARREVKEAVAAGTKVYSLLIEVKDALQSAAGWGTWDMFGGGVITTAVKHSHIDKAKNFAIEVQSAFRVFQRELKDIQLNANVEIEVDGFSVFADYFFDGLIADWFVQSKINNSLKATNNQLHAVDILLSTLKTKVAELNRSLESLQNERQQIIERWGLA